MIDWGFDVSTTPPRREHFEDNQLQDALEKCEALRRKGHQHVTISTQFTGSVGKPGVDEVKPGYDWKKRRQ